MMRLLVIKLLIFLLLIIFLLEYCNAQKKWEKIDQFKQKCNDAGGKILDPKDGKAKKICIPEDIKSAPEDPTEVTITFNNVNVHEINIKSHKLIISMEIDITWDEKRLLLGKKQIFVKSNLQNRIWSPKISLRTSDFSSKTKLKFFKDSPNDNSKSAFKSFNLETKRKCNMKFQSFPFDKQECIFEVNFVYNIF